MQPQDDAPCDGSNQHSGQLSPADLCRWQPLSDTAEVLQSMTVPLIDEQSINPENVCVEELEALVKYMEQSNESVKAENTLLENYLTTMDPTLIENMDALLDAATAAIHKAERTVQLGMMAAGRLPTSRTHDSYSTSPSPGGSSKVAAFTFADNRNFKIQPTQKIEIIQREMDCLKDICEENKRRYESKLFSDKCRKEMIRQRLKDISQLHKAFDECVQKIWLDKRNNTIAGEKIIEYFQTRNDNDAQQIKAFLTKRRNIKIQMEAIVCKSNEIGEGLKYVDYEKLKILDRQIKTDLEATERKLAELKNTNSINLTELDKTKEKTKRVMEMLRHYERIANQSEAYIDKLLQEHDRKKKELVLLEGQMRNLEEAHKRGGGPAVMEYIWSKDTLVGMKSALAITERKVRVAQMSSKTYLQGTPPTTKSKK